MKKYLKIVMACLCGMAVTACKNHVPQEEAFPQQAVNFSYEVIGEQYTLDYYVGATIRFYTTVQMNTKVTWDFGDGNAAEGKDVEHKFIKAGTYEVTATGNGGSKTQVIYIADIRPIVTQVIDEATAPDGLVTVGSTYVSFNVELPNPDSLAAEYYWTFPAGTTDEEGTEVASFVQKFPAKSIIPDKTLGKVKFSKVGSQTVKLQVKLQTESGATTLRDLDLVSKNVQVALNEDAPTVYYVVRDGTINALKLPASRTVEGVTIEPYDMGVSSGQHMLNICYDEGQIYLLDCGKQFIYVNDVDGVLGDGKMQVMSVDASAVGTVISNVGGTAFKDPYYGYVEGDYIYFADRNTGFRKMDKNTRNAVWSASEYPSYVENNWLKYYGNSTSMIYGCFNACFAREDGVWWWCKKDYGAAMWRWTDADNQGQGTTCNDTTQWPASGRLFEGSNLTAFLHDKARGVYYFAFYGADQGVYRFTDAQCALGHYTGPFSPKITNRQAFDEGRLYFDAAKTMSIKPSTENSQAEGNTGEYIGVSQMALDPETGDVYFGYRSTEEALVPSGLIRYNAETGLLEHVIKGPKIYGICINPVKSKLFKPVDQE